MDSRIRNVDQQKIDLIFVINLDRRPDRLLAFKDQMQKSSLLYSQCKRYSAIDGLTLDKNTIESSISSYGKKNLLYPKAKGLYLTKGAIALALTYKKILEENRTKNILLLEDDAVIDDNFDNTLHECLDYVPEDWDILYLGWCDSPHLVRTQVNDHIFGLSGQINGTHGWIINANSIDKILSLFPISYQIDTEIYQNKNLIKYSTNNKIIHRSNKDSDIQN